MGSIPIAILPSCQDMKLLHYICINVSTVELGSKNKKQLRGSTQATIHPFAIIPTVALWPSYCLLCVSYIITWALVSIIV